MNKLLSLLILMISGTVHALDGDAPAYPFVRNAPDNSSWTITYKKKGRPSQQNPENGEAGDVKPIARELSKVTVTKSGSMRRIVSKWSDGTTAERWIVPGYQLVEQPGQSDIYMYTAGSLSHSAIGLEDYSKSDFPELAWLTAKNFVKPELFEKTACWKFREFTRVLTGDSLVPLPQTSPPKEGTEEAGGEAPKFEKIAWIDVQSKLPVALDDGRKIMVFDFGAAPNQSLELPERFRKIVRDHEEAISTLENKYKMGS